MRRLQERNVTIDARFVAASHLDANIIASTLSTTYPSQLHADWFQLHADDSDRDGSALVLYQPVVNIGVELVQASVLLLSRTSATEVDARQTSPTDKSLVISVTVLSVVLAVLTGVAACVAVARARRGTRIGKHSAASSEKTTTTLQASQADSSMSIEPTGASQCPLPACAPSSEGLEAHLETVSAEQARTAAQSAVQADQAREDVCCDAIHASCQSAMDASLLASAARPRRDDHVSLRTVGQPMQPSTQLKGARARARYNLTPTSIGRSAPPLPSIGVVSPMSRLPRLHVAPTAVQPLPPLHVIPLAPSRQGRATPSHYAPRRYVTQVQVERQLPHPQP